MSTAFPFHFDARGRTALNDEDRAIRAMIEQVLFTSPGERVMRPMFGSGALQLAFAPNSDALGAALQTTIHAALQQTLGDRIRVEKVEASSEESTLSIHVRYIVLRTEEVRSVSLERTR